MAKKRSWFFQLVALMIGTTMLLCVTAVAWFLVACVIEYGLSTLAWLAAISGFLAAGWAFGRFLMRKDSF